jgi:hypothetical protein
VLEQLETHKVESFADGRYESRHVDGLPNVLFDLVGSRLPRRAGDTPTADDFRRAAQTLVERRFLLPSDVDLVIQQALAELDNS